jgi:hypothetical protein
MQSPLPLTQLHLEGKGLVIDDSRTIALVVALATLTSNLLSSVLFSQLPDDPYHLARNFGWYLHFANLLSVFGFIGAVRVRFPSPFERESFQHPDKADIGVATCT